MSETETATVIPAAAAPARAPVLSLSSFRPVEAIDYELMVPGTTQPTGFTVKINGPSSAKARAYMDEQSRKSLREQRQREQQQANGKKVTVEDVTLEMQRERNVRWVASRLEGWSEIAFPEITGNADAVPFSEDMAVRMLMHPDYSWVLGQLVEVISEDQRFTPASAKK